MNPGEKACNIIQSIETDFGEIETQILVAQKNAGNSKFGFCSPGGTKKLWGYKYLETYGYNITHNLPSDVQKIRKTRKRIVQKIEGLLSLYKKHNMLPTEELQEEIQQYITMFRVVNIKTIQDSKLQNIRTRIMSTLLHKTSSRGHSH